MSAQSLQLPKSLRSMARQVARAEKISVNQLITIALAEKISALTTEKYFQTRAKRGTRAKFEKAMAQVAKVEPPEFDRLPAK